MKAVQRESAAPYVVLSGTIKPGQSRDAASGACSPARLAVAAGRLLVREGMHAPNLIPPLQASSPLISPSPQTTSSCPAGYATVDRAEALTAPTPVLGSLLGGGTTPLTGTAKVEAMLGIKRPRSGDASMPPPPPKAPRGA